MKVAIIGAGPAGLACALELERHGIYPVIYEQRHRLGNIYPNIGIHLHLWTRPVKDILPYLRKYFQIDLPILSPVTKLVMRSPRCQTVIDGNLGVTFLRDQDPRSVENSLAARLQSPILFNHLAHYRELANQFDRVVVATGKPEWAAEKGIWQETVSSWIKGAILLGDFEPATLLSWYNTAYAKSGYVCLTAFDSRRAQLCLAVPYTNQQETEALWQRFWEQERLPYEILQTFILSHTAGKVNAPAIDNLLFIGAAAGLTDPFLGFGLVYSIMSGVLAGRAIGRGLDFNRLFAPLYRRTQAFLPYRHRMDTFTNRDLDRVVSGLGLPALKQFLYKTPFDLVGKGSSFLKVANFFRKPRNRYRR